MAAVIFAIAVCCALGYVLVIGPLVMKKSMYQVSDHVDLLGLLRYEEKKPHGQTLGLHFLMSALVHQ